MNNLAYKFVDNYKKIPDTICLIQKGQKTTYKDLYCMVANFKKKLEEKGIKKDNKVLILVPMSVELYVTLLAIWSIGAIPCFMDAGFIKNGMKKNEFSDINAVVGITKYILYSNINKNLKKLKIKVNVNEIETVDKNYELEIQEVENDYPGILTYTSGTTGIPKVAARTHKFLKIQGEILKDTINYEPFDIELSTIPIFTLSNISVGITTVIAEGNFTNLSKSNPDKIVNQIISFNVNRIMAAPGLLNIITDYCIKQNIELKKVTKVFTGGGAVFLDLIKKVKKVFPSAKIVTLYGSTEAEPIAEYDMGNLNDEDIEKIKNGHGILAGNIVGVDECKLIKTGIKEIGEISQEEFEDMQTEIGEIVVTGKNVLNGYVGGIGDKENKFTVEGKKFHRTGDLGVFDDKGRLWLRRKNKRTIFQYRSSSTC